MKKKVLGFLLIAFGIFGLGAIWPPFFLIILAMIGAVIIQSS